LTFTELRFFACLVPAVILFYCLPIRWRSPFLLILSYLFYLTWSVPYSVLLFALTALVYFLAIAADRASSDRARKVAAMSAVVLLAGVLAGFKSLQYWGNSSSGFLRNLAVPLGISYYTFKLISYILDVYWGKMTAERNFAALALYASFFPQILSGPIQRSPDFLDQLKTRISSGLNVPVFDIGIGFVLLGLLEKLVIADRIAPFIAQVDGALELHSGVAVLLSSYCYTLMLFADFSALTLIALGIGMLFGIQGPPNFNRPFAAANIQDFWRRWHMSLTGWLGDYLFLPLRMAFRKAGMWGLSVSILINMALIGVWHGISSNYLAFGLLHGAFMVISVLTTNWRNAFFKSQKGLGPFRRFFGQVATFHLVTLAFVFFRASSLSASIHILQQIAQAGTASPGASPLDGDIFRSALAASCIALVLGYGLFSRNVEDFLTHAKGRALYVIYGLALFAIVLLKVVEGGQFIYARF
jgi:D-alanyl-lipoteichoic acid acyltransferase DltB (MBOAT superfamily)